MIPGDVGHVLGAYAGFAPGLVISLVVALALGRRVGRMLGVRPILAAAVIMAFGVALSATVTPSYEALTKGALGSGTCDLVRAGLPSRNQLAWPGAILLNILLYVPLGAAIGLCPPSRAKLVTVVVAFAMPVAVEMVQLIAVSLGRECQSGDVIDNLTGLTLGIVATTSVRWIVQARSQRGSTGAGIPGAIAALVAAGLVVAVMFAPSPTGGSLPDPTADPTGEVPTPDPTAPTSSPPGSASLRVTSIPALLEALADDAITEIVVADGTYHVSPAGRKDAESLWIGSRFAGRTRPVTVRAETRGGVTLDGGGTTSFSGLWFVEGAHDQTWDGFVFANGSPTDTGVIMFGDGVDRAAPHHITLRNITILASCTGRATSASGPATDHAIYVSQAIGGPHDLLFEDITVDGRGGLASAFHFYHSDADHRNAWDVTIRRLQVLGTQQAIMLWDSTLRNITIDGAVITDALDYAVRFESPGATEIVLANVRSTGSGSGSGFESSLGPSPPGVTFVDCSLH